MNDKINKHIFGLHLLTTLQKLVVVSLYFIAFFLPLSRVLVPWGIFLIITAWVFEGNIITKIKRGYKQPFVILTSLFYLLHLIGLLYTDNLHVAYLDILLKLTILVFPLIFYTSTFLNDFFTRKIIQLFIYGCIIACGVCLFNAGRNYMATNDFSCFFYTKLSILMHTTYFSMYLCFALGCILFKVLCLNISKIELILFCLISFLFILVIILLSSKTGQISLVLLCIFFAGYLMFLKKEFKKAFTFIVIVGVVTTGLYKSLETASNRLSFAEQVVQKTIETNEINNNSEESTNVRILILHSALQVFKENMLIGVGTGDAKDKLIEKYVQNNVLTVAKGKYNTHDEYLQIAVTFGILGLGLLILCLFYPLVLSCINKDVQLFMFFEIIIFYFLTESMLETQAGVIFFAFFSSLFMASTTKRVFNKNIMLNRVN
jgi:O-antigen ligase